MAVYTKRDIIQQNMSENKLRFWRVWDDEQKKIAESFAASLSPEESYSKLLDVLDSVTGSYVVVRLFAAKPNTKEDGESKAGNVVGQNTFTYRVAIGQKETGVQNPLAGVDFAGIFGKVTELQAQIGELKHQNEIAELKREIAGLQKPQTKNALETLIEKALDKYLSSDFKKKVNTEAPAAPVADKPINKAAEDLGGHQDGQRVIVDSVSNIADVMGDNTLDVIGALGDFAKDNPAGFKEYAQMLLDAKK